MKKLNVAQCVLFVRNLDNIGYVPLDVHKQIDDLVVTIQSSTQYKEIWDDVYAKANDIMERLKEKNMKLEGEVNKLTWELKALEDEKGKKKEKKALRQKIGEMSNEWAFNLKAAQSELQEYQDKKLDLDVREVYIVENIEDWFYELLDKKFHVSDKEYNPDDAMSGFVERIDTDNLNTEVAQVE